MAIVTIRSKSYGTREALAALEAGNILLLDGSPLAIPQEDHDALLGSGQADGNFHKNIAYRPDSGKLTGLGKTNPGEEERVHRAVAGYSRRAIDLLEKLLAPYRAHWKTDYASFRSIEEEGRALPEKKRNDLLHTDAFPTRPTNGGLILRIFTNINPAKTRDWMTSDPFAILAPQHAMAAGLREIADASQSPMNAFARTAARVAKAVGIPVVDRSPYDTFMLAFHDYLKLNETYQKTCPKYRFNFPPGATWLVFTDVVPHAVLAGRYALEQTVIIPREVLVNRDHAPASILEKLSGRSLTDPV
jgi:hypothetical protein